MKHNINRRPTAFFITAPLPCPYIPGNLERRIVAELSGTTAPTLHDTLSRVGFRRSHGLVYARSARAATPVSPSGPSFRSLNRPPRSAGYPG